MLFSSSPGELHWFCFPFQPTSFPLLHPIPVLGITSDILKECHMTTSAANALIPQDVSLFCITSCLGGKEKNKMEYIYFCLQSVALALNFMWRCKWKTGKEYDVEKRVGKHENGVKPCYFLRHLYRRKGCLYLGDIGLTHGPNLTPDTSGQPMSPGKNLALPLSKY